MRIAIRGFVGAKLLFEEVVEVPDEADSLPQDVVDKHIARLAPYAAFMIEAEFLDEPNPAVRFICFGTDPSRMVDPVEIDLEKLA